MGKAKRVVEIAEVVDSKTLEAYLKGLPGFEEDSDAWRRQVLFIASRNALRVLPIFLDWLRSQESGLTDLRNLRSVLISDVSSRRFTSDIRIVTATFMTTTAAAATASTAAATARLASTATEAAIATEAAAAATTFATEAAVAAFATEADIWSETRADLELLQDQGLEMTVPLWQTRAPPFAQEWQIVKDAFAALKTDSEMRARPEKDVDYQFWIDWYEGYLNGKPLNTDLLYEVATSKDIDWKAEDPIDTQIAINQIWSKFVSRNSKNAELLGRRPSDAKIAAEPQSTLSDTLRKTAYGMIEDACAFLCRKANGIEGGRRLLDPMEAIQDKMERRGDRPFVVFGEVRYALSVIEKSVLDGDLDGESADLKKGVDELDSAASILLGGDEEVAEALEAIIRGKQKLKTEHPPANVADLQSALDPELAEDLVEEGKEDTATLNDDSATEDQKARAMVRWGGRIIRVARVIRETGVKYIKDYEAIKEPLRELVGWLWRFFS